eukprot:CAMPEP_0171117260 /NCGR_PEP_ID=MMETSP0766_2-20121228/92086_1 /TAXON_ID=439317 /ORGANISM="Gambierdiscus australes, Strain CAWD 149" /LENGTH=118 /DNA_ID=CAMNT_0011579759 /DNA_START=10 /DNA_END=371 /DNA_ORIENTATION=+
MAFKDWFCQAVRTWRNCDWFMPQSVVKTCLFRAAVLRCLPPWDLDAHHMLLAFCRSTVSSAQQARRRAGAHVSGRVSPHGGYPDFRADATVKVQDALVVWVKFLTVAALPIHVATLEL